MQQLILTSSANLVVNQWIGHLHHHPKQLSLVFINTAAEIEKGSKQWLAEDRQALARVGFSVTDYTLTGKTQDQLEKDLAPFDVFFVAGGNTFYLLYQAQQSGFLQLIANPDNQKTYIGSSAGSIIVCPDIATFGEIDDASQAPKLTSTKGAGLVNYLVLPHWGNPVFQAGYEKEYARLYQSKFPAVLLTDEQYLVVEAGQSQIFSKLD